MAKIVHGIDLDAIQKRKNGTRLWTPELRRRIVALTRKIPLKTVAADLGIHEVQLHQWRRGGTRAKTVVAAKGAAKRVVKKDAARMRGPHRSKSHGIVSAVLETSAIIEGLRAKHDRLIELAMHMRKTIEAFENGGVPAETVKLSDAQEPVGSRRLSKQGRDNIARASKKRWALYRRAKNKKKK